jgi:hypothetical protein
MPRSETLAIVLTPVVAMATFALGLRVGAARPARAAIVYAAPPSMGRHGLAWQVLTVREERGVREAVPVEGVTAVARAAGRESTWQGDTNADGIGEAWFDLPEVHEGDPVGLVVRARGETTPLAQGQARWEKPSWGPAGQTSPWVPASRQDGEILMDVAVYGQKLAAGFASSIWVRVRDRARGEPIAGASIDADPEPGLDIAKTVATTCANGWAEIVVTAQMHVVGLSLHATDGSRRHGEWFGALPVAPGASFVALPTEALPGKELPLTVLEPTVRPLAYLEVDDVQGRAFAGVWRVSPGPDGVPRATMTLPPLAAGRYWVVTSGEPRGAESIEVATIARPLVLREGAPADRCDAGPLLAMQAAAPFHKWVAIDGTLGTQAHDDGRRRRGLVLAWGALGVAAVLEAMLLLRAAGRGRREMAKVAAALTDDDRDAPELAPRFGVANLIIGLLLALLGFALVGSLLTWRGG